MLKHFIINVLYRAIITHCGALTRTHTSINLHTTNTRIHILHALMHRLKRISTVVNMNFTSVITVMKPRTRKTISSHGSGILVRLRTLCLSLSLSRSLAVHIIFTSRIKYSITNSKDDFPFLFLSFD